MEGSGASGNEEEAAEDGEGIENTEILIKPSQLIIAIVCSSCQIWQKQVFMGIIVHIILILITNGFACFVFFLVFWFF